MTEEHERDYKLKRLSPRQVENLAKELRDAYYAKDAAVSWALCGKVTKMAWRDVARYVLRNF